MAFPGVVLPEGQFHCGLCLDVFSKPVSIPCGHSFCSACITTHWDGSHVSTCPKCNRVFEERPELCHNSFAREMAEKIRAWKQNDTLVVAGPGQPCAVLVATKRQENKVTAQMKRMSAEVQQMISERQHKVEEIEYAVELHKRNSKRDLEASAEIFTALRDLVERSRVELADTIESEQRAAELRAERLIAGLRQEISELERRRSQMEQLHPPQKPSLLSFPPPASLCSEMALPSDTPVGATRRTLAHIEYEVQRFLQKVSAADCEKMLQYAADIRLDPRTANPWLVLSEDGKQVWDGNIGQDLEDLPERFDIAPCVLATQGLSAGRHYWEVDVGDKTAWDLGVALRSVERKGVVTLSPDDGYWTICLRRDGEYRACAGQAEILWLPQRPQIVGVFVDYEDGQVSFYDAEARSHIYSFPRFRFPEQLFPFFNPDMSDCRSNESPLIICTPSEFGSGREQYGMTI